MRDVVSTFVILGESREAVAAIPQAVDGMFRNSPLQTKTETERAFELSLLGFLGNVKAFMGVIFGAVTFAILLVSANTMAMSVRERVREVGVLKTLGFAPGAILGLILGEACAISVGGGLIGYLISMGLMRAIAKSAFGGFLPTLPVVEPSVAAACIGTAAAVGLLSALVPAMGASRLSIVQALRTTD